jgi:UDP-N-acetyl-alpha-D-muramoyl-L-alanyl-L-glutamate epimerase
MSERSDPSPFDPASIRRFRFVDRRFDPSSATVFLEYALDDSVRFVEEIEFPGARVPSDAAGRVALERSVEALHLAAGVSYYKAAVPPEIAVERGSLSPAAAGFFRELYLQGLGEFAYRNQIDLRERLEFPADGGDRQPIELSLPRRTAVPVGGGKDSAVTIEALRAAGEPMVLFSVGDFAPIRRTAAVAGGDRWVVRRRISPRLLELNRRGALNGHVPVSAVIAFILATAAVLYGFDSAALSNERSADEPDLLWRGQAINHEYSKGLAFERAADHLMRSELVAGYRYFSLLRPLSELSIAALFARQAAYHPVFRSCNAAFRLADERRAAGWCRQCPKCRFVFLVLAPFLDRRALVEIFGGDLLHDEAQAAGYAELFGLGEHRPFECVGGEEESLAALALLAASPKWRDAPIVRRFEPELPDLAGRRGLVERVLTPASEHRVPEHLSPVVATLFERSREVREAALAGLAGGAL